MDKMKFRKKLKTCKNYIKNPIYITLFTLFFLSLGYFLPDTMVISNIEIKKVDIFSKLLEEPKEEKIDDEDFFKSSNYQLNSIENQEKLVQPASILTIWESSISPAGNSIGESVEILGNTKQLKKFVDALNKSKSQKIRIAHFGDSIIEGDLVTSQIREELQAKFGGLGVGFLPITSQDVTFRQSMNISFDKNWKDYAVFTSNPENIPVGLSGEVFVPFKDATVTYKTAQYIRRQKSFSEAFLYYIPTGSSTIKYSDGNKEKSIKTKKSTKLVVEKLDISKNSRELKISVNGNSGYYYGVSLESGNGIYVDNYALRGNSGVALNNIPMEQLRQFSSALDYDLILLQFGVNALNRKNDYQWYEKEMIKVIENLKRAFPNAGIILISVHDKSKKEGSKFVSEPGLNKLLKAQMSIAKTSNIAFWNLNKAMGGENSMPKWVSSNPPLAFMDYTHFNDLGAKRVAELFVEALLKLK